MSTPESADGAFGDRLKAAREARGITLRQIADRTNLSMVALEALERDDISKLPGGIFSRAFVRAYAGEIGLDPERAVREFIARHPHDWVTAGSPIVRHDEDDTTPEAARRLRFALVVAVVLLLAAVAGLVFVWSATRGEPGDVPDTDGPPAATAGARDLP